MKEQLIVNMINESPNPLPAYATPGSAGMDLRANITEPITLLPLERKLVPTGLFMEIPMGYEGQVRPRSGMAVNKGITCLNTPGTIDSDYPSHRPRSGPTMRGRPSHGRAWRPGRGRTRKLSGPRSASR